MNSKKCIGIIDGDVLIYRSCHKSIKEYEGKQVKALFDNLYKELLEDLGCDENYLHISGGNNFRKKIGTEFIDYKGKRKEKPSNYRECKEHVFNKYDVICKEGYEADDTAAVQAMEVKSKGDLYILATVDKDWKQIGGLFYNTQYKSLSAMTNFECISFFHKQLLTGDAVDNVSGIYGIGEVKANRLLNNDDVIKQFDTVIKTYKEYHPDDYIERLNAMGAMLWLVRNYNDPIWNVDWWIKQLQKFQNENN